MVLEKELAENLFPKGEALGKQVFVGDTPAVVIGIVEGQSGSLMTVERIAYAPITFVQDALQRRVIDALAGAAVDEPAVPQAIADS